MSASNQNFYTSHNTHYAFIDGLLCDTLDKVYTTLQSQLSFPDYFGHNLDALEEVLADLEWIKEKKIKLIVINSAALLSKDIEKKEDLLSIFKNNDVDRLKIEIV
jgi:RNAse (barnase) inhibitor barstar